MDVNTRRKRSTRLYVMMTRIAGSEEGSGGGTCRGFRWTLLQLGRDVLSVGSGRFGRRYVVGLLLLLLLLPGCIVKVEGKKMFSKLQNKCLRRVYVSHQAKKPAARVG